jgi:hypothetical protein
MLGPQLQKLRRSGYVLEDAEVTGDGGSPGPSRRALLAGAAASLPLLLTACKGVQALGTPPPPARDIRVLAAAIAAEEAMVARYATALRQLTAGGGTGGAGGGAAGGPAGAGAAAVAAVAAVRAEHVAHLAQLRSRLIHPPALTSSPGPSAAATASASPSAGAGAGAGTGARASRKLVLSELEQAEQTASDRLIGQLDGLPPALAQLFASIAASEATHVPYLRAAGQSR